MPYLPGAIAQRIEREFDVGIFCSGMKQHQRACRGVPRKDGEVHAMPADGGAQGSGTPRVMRWPGAVAERRLFRRAPDEGCSGHGCVIIVRHRKCFGIAKTVPVPPWKTTRVSANLSAAAFIQSSYVEWEVVMTRLEQFCDWIFANKTSTLLAALVILILLIDRRRLSPSPDVHGPSRILRP